MASGEWQVKGAYLCSDYRRMACHSPLAARRLTLDKNSLNFISFD